MYLDERCHEGRRQICEIFDRIAGSPAANPDELLRRALLFDRWSDRYHSPGGMTVVRELSADTPAGTPEAVWGSLERFQGYSNMGDSGIWTGVALHAQALRYAVTGTAADYARMVAKVHDVLRLLDVTGVPGYLARWHHLALEPGYPHTDAILTNVVGGSDSPTEYPVADDTEWDAPALYESGLVDGEGRVWTGTVRWNGRPSIDQYTGVLLGLVMAYELLDDEPLKRRIVDHLRCYLNRLRRIEVVNLQDNPDARDAIASVLGGLRPDLDEGDIDLLATETAVFYINEQPNAANVETFDRSCPAAPALEPSQVIDAAASDFLFRAIDVARDVNEPNRVRGIDHLYAVNLSGAHAINFMFLVAAVHYLTGDEVYGELLRDEVIGRLRVLDVAHTAGAVVLPAWCRAFYGDHITFMPLYALLRLIRDPDVQTALQEVMDVEFWQKRMSAVNNVLFNLVYAATVPPERSSGRDQALRIALDYMAVLGGNGGTLDDPRRAYSIGRDVVIDNMPDGIEVVCPTESQRTICEEGQELFGVRILGEDITYECHGEDPGCTMSDGQCAEPRASAGLPPDLRIYEGFLWQGGGSTLGIGFGGVGRFQSAGLDVTESYWLARYHGLVEGADGQVLAWVEAGACAP